MATEKIAEGINIYQIPLSEALPDHTAAPDDVLGEATQQAKVAERREDCYYADDEPSALDITIDDLPEETVAPIYKRFDASKAVSVSMKRYYEDRKKMVRAVARANSNRGFVGKNDTREGYGDTFTRYGSDAPGVVAGARSNADNLQHTMDGLFLANELIDAGFAAKAVKRASLENKEELKKTFFGSKENDTARRKEYERDDTKIKEYDG